MQSPSSPELKATARVLRKKPVPVIPAAKSAKAPQVRPKSPSKREGSKDGPRSTKQDIVLSMLNRKSGATIPNIMDATGWQTHSVRGFFAGTVKKKLGLKLVSSVAEGEVRVYRIVTRGR